MIAHNDKKNRQEINMHGTYLLPYEIYQTLIPRFYLDFQMHWHEEIEIVYALQGCAKYIVDFQEYIIQEGDILIIPPLSLHSFEQYESHSFEAGTIIFGQNMINGNPLDACSTKYIRPVFQNDVYLPVFLAKANPHNKDIADLLRAVFHEHVEKKAAYELRIRILFLQFINYFYEKELVHGGQQKSISSHMAAQIKLITNYIAEHYSEKITLEELASFANISVYHLSHIFKKCTGKSPNEYVNEYRLTMAADRLAHEDTQILNIAIDSGFNNISYFNRAFKRKYGMTPKEYRNGRK